MKKYNILSVLFILALLVFSCEKEEELNISDVNHRIIVTSEMDFQNKVIVGGHIDFGDISRGVETRTWTFPENSRISGEKANTSSKEVVKGVFNKAGVYDVKLSQTFKGNVFRNDDSTVPSDTKQLDTTIVITVIDSIKSVLRAYHVNPDGSVGAELDLSNGAENEIEASNSVRLTYTAIGEPEAIAWSSDGGKPATINSGAEEEVDMRFNRLGSWDLEFIASRFRPTDADTLSFEKVIKVIPSSAPVTLDRVAEREDKIALEFSREIDGSTVDPADFTVRIENNRDEMNPILINPVISTATIDKNEANIVILDLSGEQLYNDDQVYVSYTPGKLTTVDEVESEAFTDVLLTDFDQLANLYPSTPYDYGLETSTPDNWAYLGWGGHWGEYDLDIGVVNTRTGTKSLDINFRPNGGMIVEHRDAGGNPVVITLEEGKRYEFGYWIYIESDLSGVPSGTESSDIRIYPSNWAFELIPTVFTPDLPTGEWVYQKQEFDAGFTGEVSWFIRGYNEFYPQAIKFHIDDMFLAEVPVRP